MEGVLIMISLFMVIFGIAYLYYSTRHKERLALIEKGVDASIFFSPKAPRVTPVWKIVILNLALISIGVGLGITIASFVSLSGMGEVAYPAFIFMTSGISLLIGFYLTKNIEKQHNE